MNSKLTLRLDESLIKTAKRYSGRTGKSVSRIVADYFSIIKGIDKYKSGDYKLTPLVRALKGSLKNSSIDEKDYKKYLEDKHL